MLSTHTIIPKQKISSKEKNKDWYKDNLLYWENLLINDDSSERKLNMYRNEALYFKGLLDPSEVAKICNPHNIENFELPKDFRNYPIVDPRVQTLLGEETKRRFNYKVFTTNRDAISEKEELKKNLFMEFVAAQIQADTLKDEETINKELDKLAQYTNYSFQDLREKSANELLRHYQLDLNLKAEFSKAWLNLILYGEMVFDTDCINGKPFIENVDPKTVWWAGSELYPYIDEADVVIREVYRPVGQVIDMFYEELTASDIEYLETERQGMLDSTFTVGQQWVKDGSTGAVLPDNTIVVPSDNMLYKSFQGYFNNKGEVRTVNLRWKSFKKVGKLTYLDPETNEELTDWVDEDYKTQPFEKVKWMWITEAHEVTRIGEDIYVNYGPRKIQYRKLDNKSYCSLGYVGTYTDKAIFDIMKEYQIKYNAYMYRTEQAMIKALGKLGKLDLSLIPDGWDIDMWLYYAHAMGWVVVDSFKEGKVGAATGKLAGTMGNTSDVINLEQGQFIQQNMMMLQYLESQLDLITGISPQRRGQISADQGLGVFQEAKEASANITEPYFTLLDNFKGRVLRSILEIGKYALRNKSEHIQYITSEMASKIFVIDGKLLNEAEYGLVVADAKEDALAIQTMQRAVEIALQTGAVDMIQLMDIFSNESTAEIQQRIRKSVEQQKAEQQAQFEADQQSKQAAIAAQQEALKIQMQEKEKDRELKRYEIELNNRTKLQIAEISALGYSEEKDLDNNGVPDIMEQADLALKEQKLQIDNYNKQVENERKIKADKDKKEIENKKLSLKEKELEVRKEIAEKQLKVAKANKNKYDK